jgi:hypothetical protein
MKQDLAKLNTSLTKHLQPLRRYKVVLFVVFAAGLFGYLAFQINQATGVQPTPAEQLTTVKASPRIDPALVQKIQQLQDNSVSVQALFNDSRSNPFQ